MISFLNQLEQGILIVDRQNQILFCNKKFKDELGYEEGEVEGKSIAYLRINSEQLQDTKGSILIQDKKGKYIPYKIKVIQEKWENQDANFVMCDKIREGHWENEIEGEVFEHLLETSIEAILMVDEEGKLLQVSDSFCELVGNQREEIIGKHARCFNTPEQFKENLKVVEVCKNRPGIVGNMPFVLAMKKGEKIWLDWSIKYIEEKKVFICTARDITNQVKIEEEKKAYEKQLEIENIKNEFFANISHEFKTPINIILATTQLIQKVGEVDGRVQDIHKHMKYIKQNGYRLLRLVNNFIDSNKIEAGYYELQLGDYNIVEIVEEITQSVVQHVQGKGVTLIFDTQIEEVMIACDPDKIERIMLNLLSNAIKYVRDDGYIQVDIELKEDTIQVSVKDNGIGIPNEKLGCIFDRFMQVENTLVKKSEGSGIGLSLVKALVELHGGEIYIDSEVDKGTKVRFELPIRQVGEEESIDRSLCIGNCKIEKCNVEFSDIYAG